ncbi:MAG: hypothetical protein ACFFAN_06415 [Promethearchaeota archaeon]
MSEKEFSWTVKLDWLEILKLLNLVSIKQISEFKKEKAIKKITKTFGIDTLLDFEPNELDKLVAHELKDLMKKELSLNARKQERLEKQMRSKIIPFKRGGIIKIDPRDFKDLDPDAEPEEIFKALYKKFINDIDGKDENNDEDDGDKFKEDKTGYYI